MRVAQPVLLNLEQRKVLAQQARGGSLPARVMERARIGLLAADGLRNKNIARELGMTPGEGGTVAQPLSR